MRVCVVTTGFPRWAGDGQCAFVWEAARAVARQGLQVRVVAMHSPEARTHEYIEGIEVIRPRYWWPERWEILRKEGAAGLPATWRKYPLGRFQIVPFILVHTLVTTRCARACDLIHAHWTLSAAAACIGQWIHHAPILVTLQGSDIFQVTRHPVGAWLTRKVLQRCDRITALSQALKRATAAIGIQPDKIQIIPNGVDTARFTPPPVNEDREDLILYVGSFIERKGVKYLLLAMPEVFRSLPQYRLVLAGEGPQYLPLRQLAKDLGIVERVTFLGFQPQNQIRTWMQRAKLLVLPSLEEALGVVLLEALACGTPIVASRVDGIKEVVTSDVGMLVPPADPVALSGAIQSILENPQQWADMSHHARGRAVMYYDWDRIASQYIALYQSMTG